MKYDIYNMMKCGGIKLSVFVDFPKAFDTTVEPLIVATLGDPA